MRECSLGTEGPDREGKHAGFRSPVGPWGSKQRCSSGRNGEAWHVCTPKPLPLPENFARGSTFLLLTGAPPTFITLVTLSSHKSKLFQEQSPGDSALIPFRACQEPCGLSGSCLVEQAACGGSREEPVNQAAPALPLGSPVGPGAPRGAAGRAGRLGFGSPPASGQSLKGTSRKTLGKRGALDAGEARWRGVRVSHSLHPLSPRSWVAPLGAPRVSGF